MIMKKASIFLVALSFFVLPCMTLAGTNGPSTGVLNMGDPTSQDTGIEVSLSPSVNAIYTDSAPATNDVNQWYAIGAGHPGGTTVYATAQNITNIWTKEITNATELSTALGTVPTTVDASESVWSSATWSK
jgi:hypothetical protein